MICEHELILTDENWLGEETLMVELECQKCKTKFRGLVVKY